MDGSFPTASAGASLSAHVGSVRNGGICMSETDRNLVEVLREVVRRGAADDAARVRGLLADLIAGQGAVVRVAVAAVQEGVPRDLRQAGTSGSVSLAVARGIDRLVSEHAYDRVVVTRVVQAWAMALGHTPSVAASATPSPDANVGKQREQPRAAPSPRELTSSPLRRRYSGNDADSLKNIDLLYTKQGMEAFQEYTSRRYTPEGMYSFSINQSGEIEDERTFLVAIANLRRLYDAGITNTYKSPHSLHFSSRSQMQEIMDQNGLDNPNESHVTLLTDETPIIRIAHPDGKSGNILMGWNRNARLWQGVSGIRAGAPTRKNNFQRSALHWHDTLNEKYLTFISAILGYYVGSCDKFIPLNTFEINLANVASRQQLQSGLPGELGDASKALMVSQRDAERLYSQYSQSAHRYILDH